MIEKDITINSNGATLSGTVCLPAEGRCFPVVLMIAGSGPIDRDENMPQQQLNIFNTIARHLAREGIASLRYDKRGVGKSSGDYLTTGHIDLVDDTVHWFDALQEQEFCEKIFLLGHSEGSIIAAQAGLKRPNVAGLILIAPFMDGMESILINQATQIQKEFDGARGFGGAINKVFAKVFGQPLASQKNLIRKMKSSSADTIRMGIQKLPAKWFRELMMLNPPEIFSHVTQPMLIIGGEKDLQCDPADVAEIAKHAKGPSEAHVIQNLTHILRFEEGEPSLLGSAKLFKKPMEPVVLDLIAGWLNRQRTKSDENSSVISSHS